jgi:SpoVK/Ycf46/Vps4 family AAA+-type ATPase
VQLHHGVKDLEDKVELLKGVANVLMMPHRNSEELTGRFLKKADPPTLTLDNFPHLSADTALLLPYLQHAVQGRTTGVNILLHGKPGVGKSEYVKALAAANGLDLYEISFADAGGEPIKGTGRLKAFAFCQNLLARSENALLLFDEIEDVFPDNSFALLFGGDEQGDTAGKAWINRTMERNPVPALWVSNRIHQIDPAYLRRFDYSVQFPTPPLAVRRTIAQYHLGCFNPPENWLERIAAAEEITPAQLERAAKVASLVGEANSLKLVEQVLDKSCTLLNTKAMPTRLPVKTGYSLEYLNVDADVTALLEGLQKRPSASLCFYGAAGTGKSELARHLADQLGKPLVIKRASDLLDKYVGESEKNIAAMFAEARRHGAVLVLDEADSFLSDRRDAQRSWEVTQVNELLTQMEAFDGIFICTTNLMERLDQASLRRFSFKVRFDYLTKPQRIGMFRQELTRLGGDLAHADSYEPQVARLDRLTPGDFAVAVRQFELWGTAATAQKLYEQLAKECEAKGAPVRKIGFGA